MRSPVKALFGSLALLCLASEARAQDQVYNVDFFQGPVVSSNRVIGLGGAYIGVAEGADGHLVNPASIAFRPLQMSDDEFDWDFAISWLNFSEGDDRAFDLSGQQVDFKEAGFSQAGFNLKFNRRHNYAFHVSGQTFQLDIPDGGDTRRAEYRQLLGGFGYAYTFPGRELIIGGFLLVGNVEFEWTDSTEIEAGLTGGGFQFGTLWCPKDEPWRLGAVLRTPIRSKEPSDAGAEADEVGRLIPNELLVPWELGVGGSYAFGPRPFNPSEKLDASYPRRYVMLTADLVVTGPSDNAVGVASFLNQQPQRSGKYHSVSLRAGAESEVIENRLVVRAGTYHEPDRFDPELGRIHGTLGGDVRISWGWDWRLSVSYDVAHEWQNFGMGLGFWR
ncbi:MAG: hypothetical protein ACE366_07075 [Bradymonadia bacterium]